MDNKEYAVIADIGGTNTRFASVDASGEISNIKNIKNNDFNNIIDAFNEYVDGLGIDIRPKAAAFAFAGPVVNDDLKLTNANWSFSLTETGDSLGLEYFTIVNDFVAQALAVPGLEDSERVKIGDYGHSMDSCPMAVIGAGTGLGVSCLVPDEDDFIAIPTEGGHASAKGISKKEKEVIDYLETKFESLSFERLVSGQGIENIYKALTFIETGKEESLDSEEIFKKCQKNDVTAKQTFDLFFSYLGVISGDIALMYGALGGVYLSGGILNNPDVITMLKDSDFRLRFEEKDFDKSYLKGIATYAVVAENCGLRGVRNIIMDYFENNA